MTTGKKTLAILVILFLTYAGYRYYRHTHPAYRAPAVREEVTLTIIPGWDLRQIAEYLVLKGFASTTQDVYDTTGVPARDYRTSKLQAPELMDAKGFVVFPDRAQRNNLSYEGYLSPETIRVFKDATLSEVVIKFLNQREKELQNIKPSLQTDSILEMHDVLTMASIVENETKTPEDRRLVADILWRRNAKQWALQVDSSVHYAIDKTGTVFTTGKEREVDSPWNTYKYPGLPPGPICNPSLDSINAALSPTPNDYWYFLSGRDGVMHYAKTLEEQAANKKFL